MPKDRLRNLCILLAGLSVACAAIQAETITPLRDAWKLQSACSLKADGAVLSTEAFVTDGWLKTTVPSTVLAAQAAAKVFPDPYYGANLRKIPGTEYPVGKNFSHLPMPEDSPYRCGWWYRREFPAAAKSVQGERAWLRFGGINYRGEVWLNGHRIADASTVAGAYRTYTFDVTDLIKPGRMNTLAVETFAPTEKDLGINWVDWNPCPPDKDMGLWGAVDLVTTGEVTIRSPLAVTHFQDTSLATADLTIYAEIHNALNHSVKGAVSGIAAGIRFEQDVELQANEDRTIVFSPNTTPQLHIHDPKPWWPIQMGKPHLERLTIRFTVNGRETDEKSVDFGFREITSELTTSGSRLFRVNGKPILIRGGGWSQDMLLRTDDNRLREQFRLVRDLNLNTIRLEGKLETEEFFHLADEQGILVMLGWCCCDHWEDWKNWTEEDLSIATASLRSQMLRLRHHASLLVWLNGSDNPPPADVEQAYLKVEGETHWPNPILSSASAAPTTISGITGVKMSGPYDYVAPSYWYVDQHNGGGFGFNTETSPGPAIPALASRQKFLPDAKAWPPSANWSLHNGGGEFANLKVFDEAMSSVYGKANSAAEYERIAQTMEYDSERAMFESYSSHKYISTGVVQWMLNNAWPSMIWHLYDYYLDAGAGYFAVKKACEPLHIQYSYDDGSVVVVNNTYEPAPKLKAVVQVHNAAWKELYSTDQELDAGADSSNKLLTLPKSIFTGNDPIVFIELELRDAAGRLVSRNFYWVPSKLTTFDWAKTDFTHTPAAQHEDLTSLAQLPKANVTSRMEVENTTKGMQVTLHLENKSSALAFQVHAAARTKSGDLIAPVLWSDNWIELAPHESYTLTALLPKDAVTPVIQIDGWNISNEVLAPVAYTASR